MRGLHVILICIDLAYVNDVKECLRYGRCPTRKSPFWTARFTTMDARYHQNVAVLFQSTIDPYKISEGDWVDDPKKWPPVEFGQIYAYLIESTGLFTKEKLKAYKSLQAYNYYIKVKTV